MSQPIPEEIRQEAEMLYPGEHSTKIFEQYAYAAGRMKSLSEINELKGKLERAKEVLEDAMRVYNDKGTLLQFDVNKIRKALSDLNKTNNDEKEINAALL